MNDENAQQNLNTLREQLQAWRKHIYVLELHDRERFIQWLSEALTVYEAALIIDGEILRNSLWEIYLRERSGP